jgi:hypothetical protein
MRTAQVPPLSQHIENLRRCQSCQAIARFATDTTYGGYKYCWSCLNRLYLEPVPRATVEAAFDIVRAVLDDDQDELAAAVAHYRVIEPR